MLTCGFFLSQPSQIVAQSLWSSDDKHPTFSANRVAEDTRPSIGFNLLHLPNKRATLWDCTKCHIDQTDSIVVHSGACRRRHFPEAVNFERMTLVLFRRRRRDECSRLKEKEDVRRRARKSRQKEAAGAAVAGLMQIEWSEAEGLKLAGVVKAAGVPAPVRGLRGEKRLLSVQ